MSSWKGWPVQLNRQDCMSHGTLEPVLECLSANSLPFALAAFVTFVFAAVPRLLLRARRWWLLRVPERLLHLRWLLSQWLRRRWKW